MVSRKTAFIELSGTAINNKSNKRLSVNTFNLLIYTVVSYLKKQIEMLFGSIKLKYSRMALNFKKYVLIKLLIINFF